MSRVDIALVRGPDANTSMPLPPLGMLYVAGALERAGFRVAVVDAPGEGLSQASFLQRVRMLGAAVIGLSGMTPMKDQIARDAAMVRPLTGRLVLGGVHATRFGAAVLDEIPELDALVIGEGEAPAVALMQWWGSNEAGPPPAGVQVRGRPFVPAAVPKDLDALARPARHLVPHARYRYLFQTRPGFTTMISSRGCPFRCTFCDKTVSGSPWRARSAGDVVDEMEQLSVDFGVGSLCIFDDNFTLRRSRVVDICEAMIRRDLDLHWKCEARVDGVTPDLAKLMARAGCKTVAFGVESGNQDSLDFLRKDQTVGQAEAAIAACGTAGIETVAYVLVGIPGETPESTLETLRFARSAGIDFIQFSTLSPFPGTDLYDLAMERGWYAETAVTNPVDGEERRATLMPPGWSEDDLARTLRKLYGGFYLRPGYLAKQAVRAHQAGMLAPRARLGLEVARWYLSGRQVA
ncbi:MAG: radical SAM protein [Proteobacteria bacterium]|nr:radical SAM protein [Pseudomonadota bacterium]